MHLHKHFFHASECWMLAKVKLCIPCLDSWILHLQLYFIWRWCLVLGSKPFEISIACLFSCPCLPLSLFSPPPSISNPNSFYCLLVSVLGLSWLTTTCTQVILDHQWLSMAILLVQPWIFKWVANYRNPYVFWYCLTKWSWL